jgi:hypothetical protein
MVIAWLLLEMPEAETTRRLHDLVAAGCLVTATGVVRLDVR